MECTCVRHSDLPGASKLFLDLLYNPARLHSFYPTLASDPDAYDNAAHEPVKLEMTVSAAGQPVGEVRLASPPLDDLRKYLGEFPFGGDVVALVSECYGPGATMGQAFGALLRRLLDRFGLLQLDPM